MAVTSGVLTNLDLNNAKLVTLTTIATPADGITFDLDHDCQRAVLILAETGGSADATFNVKVADSFLSGAAYEISSIAVTKSTQKAVVIECGRYKELSGANKGKILITAGATGTVKAGLITLPM